MGMNYYTATKPCKTCSHTPKQIHLGKSSAGWQFSFAYNGGQFYKNIEEMVVWLADKEIENEYGETVSHKEFWDMVESKQKDEFKNHAHEMHKNYPEHVWRKEYYIDGYSFSDCEFS